MTWKSFPHHSSSQWITTQINSNAEIWGLLCCLSEQVVEQTVELLLIWDAMKFLMSRHHYMYHEVASDIAWSPIDRFRHNFLITGLCNITRLQLEHRAWNLTLLNWTGGLIVALCVIKISNVCSKSFQTAEHGLLISCALKLFDFNKLMQSW